MKSYRELISEDVDLTPNVERGVIDVDNHAVRNNINTFLNGELAHCVVTPYVALNRVNKVLANFHIFLPKAPYMENEHGFHVFKINQFNRVAGMRNDGTVVTKIESPYNLYFEWKRNEKGMYDVFAEIVTEDELEDLLDAFSDDVTNINEGKLRTIIGVGTGIYGAATGMGGEATQKAAEYMVGPKPSVIAQQKREKAALEKQVEKEREATLKRLNKEPPKEDKKNANPSWFERNISGPVSNAVNTGVNYAKDKAQQTYDTVTDPAADLIHAGKVAATKAALDAGVGYTAGAGATKAAGAALGAAGNYAKNYAKKAAKKVGDRVKEYLNKNKQDVPKPKEPPKPGFGMSGFDVNESRKNTAEKVVLKILEEKRYNIKKK